MASAVDHHVLDLPSFDTPVRILIVVSPYYKAVAEQLVQGAQSEVEKAGGVSDVIQVPGALEIPTAISLAHAHAKYDGFVALGCVVRGETTHYETVCNDSSRAIQLMGLQGVCIGNGILTVENMDQAEVRADAAGQNKGGGAAAAALHLIALARKWRGSNTPIGFKPGEAIKLA